MDWKKEFRDQSAHLIVGAVAVLPIAFFGLNPLTGMWATLTIGLAREVTEFQCARAAREKIVGEIGRMEIADIRAVINILQDQLPNGSPFSVGSIRDLAFWALSGFVIGFL